MNIPYSMITVGCGMESTGFGQQESSFIGQLTREANCACLGGIRQLDGKNAGAELQELIDRHNPDIILWQDEVAASRKSMAAGLRNFVSQRIIYPFLPFLARKKNEPRFRSIKAIIDTNPRKYFIILSPQPETNGTLNRIASKRAAWLKTTFASCPNVTYINLTQSMNQVRNGNPAREKWSHYLMASLVAKKSGLSLFAGRGNFAA